MKRVGFLFPFLFPELLAKHQAPNKKIIEKHLNYSRVLTIYLFFWL